MSTRIDALDIKILANNIKLIENLLTSEEKLEEAHIEIIRTCKKIIDITCEFYDIEINFKNEMLEKMKIVLGE